jgi:hypothetical protein
MFWESWVPSKLAASQEKLSPMRSVITILMNEYTRKPDETIIWWQMTLMVHLYMQLLLVALSFFIGLKINGQTMQAVKEGPLSVRTVYVRNQLHVV